jgi:hypothetical protein
MYSVEYKWTSEDTEQTTNNITHEIVSKSTMQRTERTYFYGFQLDLIFFVHENFKITVKVYNAINNLEKTIKQLSWLSFIRVLMF